MASQYTMEYLKELQGYPLEIKIQLTKQRIREWVHRWGVDGVYVSFSGGKDSTVLLHIVREMYPDVLAVFVDTGLEYPEIRQFVRTFDNVIWLKPKKNFRKIIEDYGYPFISKEVSEKAYYAKKYILKVCNKDSDDESDFNFQNISDETLGALFSINGNAPFKAKALFGTVPHKENGIETGETSRMFDFSRYSWLVKSPFMISSHCCNVMKKAPMKNFQKTTGKNPMTAQMATESRLRMNQWLANGCNGFELKSPISNPMSFWTEQDVLQYIKSNGIPIASVYGDIVVDDDEQLCGQISMFDYGLSEPTDKLKTTGCHRTGCIFCGYGCHREKPGEGRFERLKITHPQIYDYIMRPWEQGGLNYKEVIDWINEHGDLHIRY